MNSVQALVLGIIQGLTEFLPISSSGHLIFVPRLFGWADQGLTFDAVVHLGSLFAVLVYFRSRILSMLGSLCTRSVGESDRKERKLAFLLAVSIVPAALGGLFFQNWIENSLRSVFIISFSLIFWGIILGWADRLAIKRNKSFSLDNLSFSKTVLIGIAQALALIPGTSRSGVTMSAGLFLGLDKKSAADFSFLMSVPIIAIAGALKIFDLVRTGWGHIQILPLGIGFFAAALSGFLAIAGLMKIIQKWSFMPFVVYRVAMGILILVFFV
ncbi:MAG: undecaprenyl-diphosphate phosphatase [Candidatus Magasanikbacteria bacterium]|nr:undecaprenyl-diphosphate phosphatase [Candidatus Magasanikbacteria bacterium]